MKRMNFAIITLIIGLLFLTAGVSAAQQITISNVVMNPDGTGTATVTMDSAPTGLAGFKLNLAITNPSVCDNITLVTYPAGFNQYDTKGSTWSNAVYSNNVNTLTRGGFSSGYIKAMDNSGESFPDGSTNILLATVTLHGLSAGSTTLDGTILSLSDNYGTNYIPTTTVNDGSITVNGPPTAAFTANPTSGTAPLAVQFTDQSTSTTPLSYQWDFNGDRVTDSILKDPLITFSDPGTYPVNLTVTNIAGSNSLVKPNYIVVSKANTAPVAAAQSVSMDENTAKDITLVATDADGDTLTYAVVSAPAHGTLGTVSAAGVVTYTPAADYVGSDSFTFKANDGKLDSAPATVTITVNNVNKAPVAADQTVSTNENTARDITLGATDADGDLLTFVVVTAPSHGTLGTISAAGVVTYTPVTDYNGPDSFTFKANDGTVDSNTATISISVDNVNKAPVAAAQSVSLDENTAKDITLVATDADGDTLTYAVVAAPAHGTLGTVSASGVVTYTPAADYSGPDSFTFKVNDGTVDSNTATVSITVNNVNKVPVAAAQSVSLDENTAKDITLSASDDDGDTLTYAVVGAPAHGTLGTVSATGVVTYTPAVDYVGSDSFTFKANDGTVDSNTATVSITVNNVNKVPVAAAQSVSLDENTAKDITLVATDADGDALTFAVVATPAHGTLGTVSASGVVTYTPAADYTGSDSFTFKANDGTVDSNTATVTITVNNVNKVPVAAAQAVSMDENTAKDITLSASDADGDTLTYAVVAAPAHGTLGTVSATGVVTYTPAVDYVGSDSFTFKANDGTVDSNIATVSVTINNVNKVPVANAQSVSTDKNVAKEITLTGSDADGDALTYAVVAAPAHGTLGTVSAAGVVTYTPAADYAGSDSFTFKVNDGTADSVPATVDITVNAVNIAPVANAQAVSTDKNVAKEITLTGSDVDGDTLTFAVVAAPAHGTLGTISATGVVTYTPAADYTGIDSFTFKVNDGTADSAPATVDITVNAVNTAPVANAQAVSTDKNVAKEITLTGSDADGNTLTFAVVAAPAHGTLGTVSAAGVVTYTPAADYTGTDSFTFKVNDGTADSAPATVDITINAVAPVASFTTSTTSGVAPLFVRFTDTSGNTPTSWAWDFGDGSTSTTQSPTHTYMAAGTYTVTLTATNTVGSNDKTATIAVTVSTGGLANTAWPKAQNNLKNTGLSDYTGPQTNTTIWINTTGGQIRGSATIGADGTIYVGTYSDKKIYAFNPDGSQKWTYPTTGYIYGAPTIGADGTIYIGSYDKNLYALNPDGTLKWTYTAVDYFYESATIGADGTIYIGDHSGNCYALNPNGTLKWKYSIPGLGIYYGAPAIGSDGTIFIGVADGAGTQGGVYALNPDGTLKWSYNTYATFYAPSIGSDGTIYAAGAVQYGYAYVYALNPDGTLKWSYSIPSSNNGPSGSPAIGPDGTVYVGTKYYTLIALNPSGTLKWSYPIGTSTSWAVYTPTVGSDGTIYFGSYNKKIYALNSDGTQKWNYTTGNYVYGAPTIGSDGTLYIGSYDKKFYAFHDPITPVAAFSSDTQTGAAPLTVTFIDQSANKPTSWLWDFGDNDATNATKQSPVHTYASAGTYTVKLTATNAAGSDDEEKTGYITVSVQPAPVAAFTSDVQTGTAPLTVTFTNQSTGYAITAFAWDFENDGTIDSTVQDPVHTYTTAGTYTVNLTVTNAGGSDSEVKTDYITVNAANTAPVAADQSVSMDENTAKDITLAATDADGNPLTFAVVAAPAHGTLGTISATGVVTYTPAADYRRS